MGGHFLREDEHVSMLLFREKSDYTGMIAFRHVFAKNRDLSGNFDSEMKTHKSVLIPYLFLKFCTHICHTFIILYICQFSDLQAIFAGINIFSIRSEKQ